MKNFSINAYAKINLYLDVLSKRQDGYHNICSVVSLISLHDSLHFQEKDQGYSVLVNGVNVPENKENLVYKLLSLLHKSGIIKHGLDVFIDKQIPVGAGLGGGSADVAFTLIAMNNEFSLALSRSEMESILLQIGMDCPLFLTRTGNAFIEGKGERITDINVELPDWIIILFPYGITTSAKTQYETLFNKRLTKNPPISTSFLTSYLKEKKNFNREWCYNKFEQVLIEEQPIVFSMLNFLLKGGAERAQMTGTGSAVFGFFSSLSKATSILKKAKQFKFWAYLTKSIR